MSDQAASAAAPAPRRGTAILVWAADLAQPERCATLFMTAQACRALDLQVELYFTGPAVRLLLREEQSQRVGYGSDAQPLSHHLAETQRSGAQVVVCSQALHHLQIDRAALVDGCAAGGVVQFAARCADRDWATLVF
ncbi:MAG: DsrE family protein [Burkholderiaceae bacterium]